MTEQYSAYQTLAAQAAITQQLRAASDSSQVGRRSNGVTAMENNSEVVSPPIFQIVTMAPGFIVLLFFLTQQALATQVALAQYVQQVQQANQAQVRQYSVGWIANCFQNSSTTEKPQKNTLMSQAAASSKPNMLGNMAMLQVRN